MRVYLHLNGIAANRDVIGESSTSRLEMPRNTSSNGSPRRRRYIFEPLCIPVVPQMAISSREKEIAADCKMWSTRITQFDATDAARLGIFN
jgi:hypothetical protein